MEQRTEAVFREMDERTAKGDRLTLQLTAREAHKLHFLLRLALRDQDIDGLWNVTELAADLRERIAQWLSETPAVAAAIAEDKEWERKYEASFKR